MPQSDHEDHRSQHIPQLGPSYNMDFDRPDYASNPYSLNSLQMGNSAGGLNDISALAAAASDQLYELERHEAFRRAEYDLRRRQLAESRSKSNGGSPVGTPSGYGAYGFSNERDRWALQGAPAAGGGQIVYPISAGQPATVNHPAVPAGTLADPTYLVPPPCCHEDCHKSYRKRLKVAKQTQACPNCLTTTHGGGSIGHPGIGGAGPGPSGGGGGDSHHSSSSNTPKERSNVNSSEDLSKLGGGGGGGGGNSYNLHHHNLHHQLARLQQQHLLALQKSHQNGHRRSVGVQGASSNLRPYTHDLASHRGFSSAHASRAPSPSSSDSSDDELVPITAFDFTPATSPVLASLRHMSLLQGKATTAPTSAATSPIHSRNPSRATSPVEGHSAMSGKHGYGSHTSRDAKHRSHPYTHHSTTPNSPHFAPVETRVSPPDLHRTLSGSNSYGRPSVEDILNSSALPPPPHHSDRMLPPPNSSTSFISSNLPSASYSLSSQPASTHVSPNTSPASSPAHSVSHSLLAHSVHAAFGMTPISGKHHQTSPPHKLAPLSIGGNTIRGTLPSFSRGSSPVHLMGMEVDGQA